MKKIFGLKRIIALLTLMTAGIVISLFIASCSTSINSGGNNGFTDQNSQTKAGGYNYGEALQKAIMFYEFQRSGTIPSDQRDNWRGNSGMSDAVLGGYYDAGDHVKFNLPMAFSASMMAWSLYENASAYTATGQTAYIQKAIQWVCDYLVGCQSGNIYQIGDGSLDHAWWGPCEVMQMSRPAASSAQCSAVWGESAAALAAASKVLGNSSYLSAAKTYFSKAESAMSDSGYTAANGYYNSWSGFYDELVWAAVWLYIASGDSTYLTKAQTYFGNIGMEGQSSNVAYKWTQSWDDKHYGAELLLAKLTGGAQYKTAIENNLDYWTTGGPDGSKITYTPKGLAHLDNWGCIRYAMGASTLAFCYANWSGANATKAATYKSFAETQVNYALGSTGRSYIIGFGSNYPQHPHHRTAESSWADSQTVPPYCRHTLIGALVGGPDASDNFTDDDSQYQYTEPACDYNACLIGALAYMYNSYGGTPVANLTANETPSNLEYFVQTAQNATGNNFFEVKFDLFNESGWPARALSNSVSFRYFFDISELVAKGHTASDITLTVNYNQDSAGVATLKQWSGNIYYINVNWTGLIYPGGQSMYKKEIQVRFTYPTDVTNDNSNDWSYQYFNNVVTTGTTNNPNVPVYINGTKVYGNEPGAASSSAASSVAASSRPASSVAASSIAASSVAASSSLAASSIAASSRSSVASSVAVSSSRSSVASSVAVSSVASSVAVSSAASSVSGGYAVNYTVNNDWGAGATCTVTIKNNSATALSSWSLVWTFAGNQAITQIWSATQTSSGETVTVNNLSYNNVIGANGGTQSFGFNLSYSGSNAKPTSFTLNGTACTLY